MRSGTCKPVLVEAQNSLDSAGKGVPKPLVLTPAMGTPQTLVDTRGRGQKHRKTSSSPSDRKPVWHVFLSVGAARSATILVTTVNFNGGDVDAVFFVTRDPLAKHTSKTLEGRSVTFRVQFFFLFDFIFLTSIAARFLVTFFKKNMFLSRLGGYPSEAFFFLSLFFF